MKQIKSMCVMFISMLMVMCMFTTIGCAPDNFTPSEKVQFTTMQGLQTAYDFRIFALNSAKVFWDRGMMDKDTMEIIVIVGDNFQFAINEASKALEIYKDYSGSNAVDLSAKIIAYQDIYVQFNNLVMPYIMTKIEE